MERNTFGVVVALRLFRVTHLPDSVRLSNLSKEAVEFRCRKLEREHVMLLEWHPPDGAIIAEQKEVLGSSRRGQSEEVVLFFTDPRGTTSRLVNMSGLNRVDAFKSRLRKSAKSIPV